MPYATEDEVRGSIGLPNAQKKTDPVSAANVLNGAQVQALVSVLEKVYAKTLPASAAREIILGAFPDIAVESIDRMLASAPAITPVVDTAPAPAVTPVAP